MINIFDGCTESDVFVRMCMIVISNVRQPRQDAVKINLDIIKKRLIFAK